jgi:hypothetical protein
MIKMATEVVSNVPSTTSPGKKQRRSDLTSTEYEYLHKEMRKQKPQPKRCQICKQVPPYDLACVGEYESNPKNFKWMCRKCHVNRDDKAGLRPHVKPRIREIYKIVTTATIYGKDNSHVITPKGWLNQRIWCLIEKEYNALRGKR